MKVKFADGHEETIFDDPLTLEIDEANERLKEICKIHDKYRHIPTTLIDNSIRDRNSKIIVDDDFIDLLEYQSKEQLKDKKSIIEQYISKRTTDKIPITIEFGYPLKWEFDELRIVDSPGVNATGGVQDISFNYFASANAILFVKDISAIEMESFNQFVNSIISNRSRETLFLVLTKGGLKPNSQVERLHKEAVRLYSNIISEDRILAVDSLAQIIFSELQEGKTQEEIESTSEEKEEFLAKFEKRAKKENTDLQFQLENASRFKELLKAIDDFSMKAPFLQLQEILEQIKSGYEDQESQYVENIGLLELKKKTPQEFEKEINRIANALIQYSLLAHKTKEKINAEFSDSASWDVHISTFKVKYPELIIGSESIESARKNTIDALDAIQYFMNDFLKKLTLRLDEALKETGESFSTEHSISIPKVDLKAIEEKSKINAYNLVDVGEERTETIWDNWNLLRGRWSRKSRTKWIKTGTNEVFDDEKFLGNFKSECIQNFFQIVNDLKNKQEYTRKKYLDLFEKEINSIIANRQETLKEVRENKTTNEGIINEITELKEKKNKIQPEIERCIEVLEDLI